MTYGSLCLDVERLAQAMRNADASMRDERGRSRNRTPTYWRDLAKLLFVLIPTLADPPEQAASRDVASHQWERGGGVGL